MLIIAHRGACDKLPENSMAAIKLAAREKFDGIEFDVRTTRDKFFLIMHDKKLNRTTNSRGKISKKHIYHIEPVKLKNGENIPSLDDVLNLLSKNILCYEKDIFVEIKDSDHEKDILSIVKKYSLQKQVIITSFNFRSLQKIRILDKKIRLCLDQRILTKKDLKRASSIKCYAVGSPIWTIRKKIVVLSRKHKILVLSFQMGSQLSMNRAKKIGVDGVFLEKYARIK